MNERAAHIAYLPVLRDAALAVAAAVDPPVIDPGSWRHPGGQLIEDPPAWPADPGCGFWVAAGMHLARTALLSCADHIAGLAALVAAPEAPMLPVATLARSATEAAAQAWWLRVPLAAGPANDAAWATLADRACAVATFWWGWGAHLGQEWTNARRADGRVDAATLTRLEAGVAHARESARTHRPNSNIQFAYGTAARELLAASGASAPGAEYARLCEAAHGNPLAVTRSAPTPALEAYGLMPLTATPPGSALRDDDSVDAFLVVTTRAVRHCLWEAFNPSAGRTWGLPPDTVRSFQQESNRWVDAMRSARSE